MIHMEKQVTREILHQLMNIIYAIPVVILAFRSELELTVKESFYILLGYAVAISLFRVSKAIEEGIIIKVESSHYNPNSNKEKARKEDIPLRKKLEPLVQELLLE